MIFLAIFSYVWISVRQQKRIRADVEKLKDILGKRENI
jgi:hypothetical protein